MNDRQARLLTAIIDEFIGSGLPVGSKAIIEKGYFDVSGATIRNEMQTLSDAGFIEQPHTSAGRIPTALGYRTYVKEYMEPSRQEKLVRRKFQSLKEHYLRRKDQERVYEAVSLLSRMTPHVCFASIPHRNHVYYMGLANILRQPEFIQDTTLGSSIAEVLEEKLSDLLSEIDINEEVCYFIGDEHILDALQSCSMLVTTYTVRGERGALGILGPIRMDYAFNTIALEMVADLLRS